jgi:hypothetical protein
MVREIGLREASHSTIRCAALINRSRSFAHVKVFERFLVTPFLLLGFGSTFICSALAEEGPGIRAETPAQAKLRHTRIAQRRQSTNVICHRGASEFAHENTLEAYRATFELGAGGNEIDIRQTKDGVLVCFHDDMLDRILDAFGDVSDYNWNELRQLQFRDPGPFGEQCRIPTLVEVFELHRRHGGLIHLDIKRPGLDSAVADLLTRMDMWDHVAHCNTENGDAILQDPRLKLRRYKAPGMFEDRSETFPEPIAAAIHQPGDDLIVDDPRGVLVSLGRKIGQLSKLPVAPRAKTASANAELPDETQLIAILRNADDWNQVADSPEEQAASARRITARARAAGQLLAIKTASTEAFAALKERVHKRSLHKDWRIHGLDGAIALRSLLLLGAPEAVETARVALWRDDPALQPLVNPQWNSPRSVVDFRVKMVVFPALKNVAGPDAEKLCRDYLALSETEARRLGILQFQEAAHALLAISPRFETARELLQHSLQAVRGRAILDCVAHADEPWAREALERHAPHALAYRVGYRTDEPAAGQ